MLQETQATWRGRMDTLVGVAVLSLQSSPTLNLYTVRIPQPRVTLDFKSSQT